VPPFREREWKIQYDFDSSFLFSRDTRMVSQAAEFAIAAKAKSVEITAQRGATLLSNGKTVTENAAIAAERAEKVATLLRGLGTEGASIKVRVVPEAVSVPESRMVLIRVVP
jgi:hypothetical protein